MITYGTDHCYTVLLNYFFTEIVLTVENLHSAENIHFKCEARTGRHFTFNYAHGSILKKFSGEAVNK